MRRRRATYLVLTLGAVAAGYAVSSALVSSSDSAVVVADQVRGDLVQVSDNGAWSWFQDERAVIDPAARKLVVGASANRFGVGGRPRDGDIDATIFDLETGQRRTFTLKHHLLSRQGGDDHNAPALLIRPDGAVLAVYANHNRGKFSYYRIYEDGRWSRERRFDWDTMPGGSDSPTTYSNLLYLSAEDRVYNFARSDERSPNIMVSDDLGRTWSYGGQLTDPEESFGYANGYLKYASNGVDRIDFIATEHHPRDFDTSIYHGYLRAGRTHAADGTVLDKEVADKSAPAVERFTPVFEAGTTVDGVPMMHAWPIDLETYDDGTIAALFQARAQDSTDDHRFFYARYDGGEWSWEYLGKAGPKLYGFEEDYTGLGSLDPDDPDTAYLSTPIDPRDDAELGAHEIFEGTRGKDGWKWTPVTQNSTRDNLRPVVPDWNGEDRALIWWRGTYTAAQKYDAAVVGVFDRASQRTGAMRYVDASAGNTERADGSPLGASGPAPDSGPADGRWHQRTGEGGGGDMLASAERDHENAPALKTSVSLPESGTYDLWVNFWAKPSADWRINAGLAGDEMHVFRGVGSQPVEEGAQGGAVDTSSSGGARLHRAYLGRVDVRANAAVDVFVDDYAFAVGPRAPRSGNDVRTWYDGVSYAAVKQE